VSGRHIILRMSAPRYAKNAGAVFSLKFRVVFCPKYRRPVLTPPVDGRLKPPLAEIADDRGMTLHATEVMPDHVHLVVEANPTLCVAEIVNRFKGRTSRLLREEFPALRSRLPTLWSRSYFAASVGAVSEATIRRYVAAQKGA
jgi:putative transposase